MVAAPVAVVIVAVCLFSLGTGGFLYLLDRRGRTRAEQNHWARWDAECREFGCHDPVDWEREGWA